jgi:tubulin--tyrosine ligase-like protein 12
MAGVKVPGEDADEDEDEDDVCANADSDTDGESELEADSALRPRAWSRSVAVPQLGASPSMRVLASTYRLLGCYRLTGPSGELDDEPIWYLTDEFASAMRHASQLPTMRCSPFVYQAPGAPGGVAFSLAWPVRLIDHGEEATRDMFHMEPLSPALRQSLCTCFFRMGREEACRDAWAQWRSRQAGSVPAPIQAGLPPPALPPSPPLRVYTDIDWVQDDVTRAEFVTTPHAAEAHIVWTKAPLDAATLSQLAAPQGALVNQFPGEECLVFKHRLAQTARRAATAREWLPLTFDATADLDALLGAHEEAVQEERQPLWIMKPWNSGRSLGITVAATPQAVAAAVRAGPKVAQQYIARPALYRGRKFDVRVLVAVTSFVPLVASMWHEVFIRVANKPYDSSPAALGDFQTTFTSMRQRGYEEEAVSEAQLAQEVGASGGDWAAARRGIQHMLRDLLTAAAPEVGPCPAARALYGVDVMFLEGSLAPQLLEVTFCPGVERPMAADPHFLDKVFGHLFLGETAGFEPLP